MTLRRLLVLGFAAAMVCASATCVAQDAPEGQPQQLPALTLRAGIHNITARLAATPREREIGLMYRQKMPVNEGMLFVFDLPATQCFWMKNTLIPLQVAFIAEDGTVVNIDEMKPQTLDSHCSAKPVRYVLEMNTGWFTRRGIKAGSKLDGPPFEK